jgi:tRNA pseudouridine38-40 synthase
MSDHSLDPDWIRLKLDVAYDGTNFAGWARQPGLRTVQGELESALAITFRSVETLRVAVAGRTDAGVHARGQVTHCDVPVSDWEALLARGNEVPLRRLAGVLPGDLRVRAIGVAPPGFHARWSALARTYRYRVSDVPGGADPLVRFHVLHHRCRAGERLNIDAMNEAAAPLLGEHDFTAFCKQRPGASSVRTLQHLEWVREPESDLAVMTIRADAFCHSMVRSIVGALLPVGDGRKSIGWPAELLAARMRIADVHVVAPIGLCLEHVEYPPDDELAAQAERAKRFRGNSELNLLGD